MNHLPALHVGSPTLAGPLTVFPVWTDAPAAARAYLPLSASVAAVREKASGGSVGHRARTFARRVERMRLDVAAHEPGRSAVLDSRDDLAATRALTAAGHVVHASALNVRHSLVLAA